MMKLRLESSAKGGDVFCWTEAEEEPMPVPAAKSGWGFWCCC